MCQQVWLSSWWKQPYQIRDSVFRSAMERILTLPAGAVIADDNIKRQRYASTWKLLAICQCAWQCKRPKEW